MPKAIIKSVRDPNPKKTKIRLYVPVSRSEGFDARVIKGIMAPIPTVSINDKSMARKVNTNKYILYFLGMRYLSFVMIGRTIANFATLFL
jgi:hypothetical protein